MSFSAHAEGLVSGREGEDNEPVDGKTFVALRDLSATCIVILSPMKSDMRDVVVPAGEVIQVVSAHDDLVSCRPERYAALEADMVAPDTRAHAGYKGYGLVIDRFLLERYCAPADKST